MPDLLITYRDFSGETTERRISDLRMAKDGTYDALCHIRNDRRSFKPERILRAIDAQTGEILNPYCLLGEAANPSLDALAWSAVAAIKALKFFTLSIRGFAKRERQRVLEFVHEVVDVKEHTEEEVSEWLYKLWCGSVHAYRAGDVSEYLEELKSIPPHLLARCRDYALLIAGGSGRKAIAPELLQRIDAEFSATPDVKPPPNTGEPPLGITIGVAEQ